MSVDGRNARLILFTESLSDRVGRTALDPPPPPLPGLLVRGGQTATSCQRQKSFVSWTGLSRGANEEALLKRLRNEEDGRGDWSKGVSVATARTKLRASVPQVRRPLIIRSGLLAHFRLPQTAL